MHFSYRSVITIITQPLLSVFDEETAEAEIDEIHQCYTDVEEAYRTIVFGCMGEDFAVCWEPYEEEYGDLRAACENTITKMRTIDEEC